MDAIKSLIKVGCFAFLLFSPLTETHISTSTHSDTDLMAHAVGGSEEGGVLNSSE